MKVSELKVTAELLEAVLALPDGARIVGARYEFGWPVSAPDILHLRIASEDFPEGTLLRGTTYRHECEGKAWLRTELEA